jgi:hypothetical protein
LIECNNIIKLKDSLLFKYLINIFKNQRSPTDYIWRNLVKNGYFNINIINDNDIYRYFNLTPEEVNIIESNVSKQNINNKISLEPTTANTEQVITTEPKTQPIKVLQDLKISELKNIARTEGIKGYSKYTTETKNELIEKIEKFRTQIEPKTQPIKVLRNLKITELKNIARTEGIKGYSKYTTETKNELIEKIEKFRIDKL